MSDVMIDLSCTTFHVPLVDHRSPLAYSIINEVQWYNKVARHPLGGILKIYHEICVHHGWWGFS